MIYKTPLCSDPGMEGIAQAKTNVMAACWLGRVSHCSCELIQKKHSFILCLWFEPKLNVSVSDWGATVAWLPPPAASQACSLRAGWCHKVKSAWKQFLPSLAQLSQPLGDSTGIPAELAVTNSKFPEGLGDLREDCFRRVPLYL